jgi:hypothetical protein
MLPNVPNGMAEGLNMGYLICRTVGVTTDKGLLPHLSDLVELSENYSYCAFY